MRKGFKHSEESKQKMREASLRLGLRPPSRLGTTFVMSEEHKENIRLALIGGKRTAEARKKMSLAKLGTHRSEETKRKISEANIREGRKPPFEIGEKHPNWKGDDVGYGGLHMWVNKWLGKPNKCSICGKVGHGRQMHWANRDHTYQRNLSDWLRLCVKCHSEYDRLNSFKTI